MEAKNRVEQLFLMTEISLNSKNVNLINDFLIRVKTALFRMMIGSFLNLNWTIPVKLIWIESAKKESIKL